MRAGAAVVVAGVLACALAAGGSATSRSAPAQSQWALTDLGTLAGDEGTSFALGIDNRGRVVGYSTVRGGALRAFLWQHGRMRGLGALPGFRQGSSAVAINDRGQIVGTSTAKDGKAHAFLWQDGRMRDHGRFLPFAINDRGQVVGWSLPGEAVMWEEGSLRRLGLRGRQSQASGIDEQGHVVGFVGCDRLGLWVRSRPSPSVATLRRNRCAAGNHDIEFRAAINERGQVAATGNGEAYLWQRGRRLALETLPGAQRSVAVAINDRGQIVGASGWAHHFELERAVLWTPTAAG